VNRLRSAPADAGFTLIEMMIAMLLSAIVGGILLTTLISSSRVSALSVNQSDLTAEARGALNRMALDLSQANPLQQLGAGGATTALPAITDVQNPDGPNYSVTGVTSVTFNADFDGDGCVAGVTSNNLSPVGQPCNPPPAVDPTNPETETFCWDPSAQQIYLLPGAVTAGTCQPAGGGSAQPLLSGKVTSFEIFYRSNLYLYQDASKLDPQATGTTTWYDLDASGPPVGNDNNVLDTPELLNINSLVIQMTMTAAGHSQRFSTGVELRNVNPS